MAIATRFFSVTATSAGLEIPDIIEGIPDLSSGYVDQIIIRASSGGGSSIDVEIRYTPGDSSRENLVYLYESGTLPSFIDSSIKAPFDLKNKTDTPEDLTLYIEPESSGDFEIRIDFDLDRVPGAAS